MKILTIGSDRQLFTNGSKVRQRIIDLASVLIELHIIVFNKRSLGLKEEQIAPNVWIYPTNSVHRWSYVFDAVKLGHRFRNIQVVSAQDPFESGLAAWFISRRLDTKLQLQIHTDFLSPYFRQESFLNKIRVRLARFLLSKADGIRVVNQRIKDSLIAKFKIPDAKIIVLPVFVDIEKIRQAPIKTDLHKKYSQFDQIVLMASRLTREKNIGLAIEAMNKIIIRQQKTGLIIVGSGPEEKNLKLKAKSHKLEANVLFEPWTDNLPSYYKTVDLFLVTSLYEGYGRTIVEALACGLPVVSTDVGVAREVGAIIARDTNLADLIEKTLSADKKADFKDCPILDKQLYLKTYLSSWTI